MSIENLPEWIEDLLHQTDEVESLVNMNQEIEMSISHFAIRMSEINTVADFLRATSGDEFISNFLK